MGTWLLVASFGTHCFQKSCLGASVTIECFLKKWLARNKVKDKSNFWLTHIFPYFYSWVQIWTERNKRFCLISEFHCRYGNLTLRNNEQWSGELCGGIVQCKDGIATVKKCPGIPPKPDDCAKPRLLVEHRSGRCCHMKWKCKGNKW